MSEAIVDLTQLTIPTPEPFDKTQPERQRENLAYVGMQILSLFKQAGVTISSKIVDGSMTIDVDGLTQAVNDLQFQGIILDSNGTQIYLTRKSGGTITI